ncbi:MAG: hypothetical protein M3487_01605 [Actinomycetota bacterium]|nr:hypothetical protein [Actinomycetota bacterium]
MSQELVGADLAHLDALATAYDTAGREVALHAEELRGRLGTAVSSFQTTMSRLQAAAGALTTAMDDEVAAVANHAATVGWTGANRHAFDADLHRFVGIVRTGAAAIDDGVADLRTDVDQRFAPVLDEFGVSVRDAAGGIDTATTEMRTSVAAQRDRLDEAANVGWTNA